jgi:signal transduction histidine kinase
MTIFMGRPVVGQATASMQRLRRTIVILFLCFMTFVSLAGILHLAEQYRSAVDEATRTARASVRTAESFTSRTLAETYRVLEGVGDVYRTQVQHQSFDEGDLHRILAAKIDKLPHVAALLVLDTERKRIAAARIFPVYRQPLDDDLRNAGMPVDLGGGLLIGKLYSSEKFVTDGPRFYLPVGVRIEQDGKTIGYAVAILHPEFFSAFFKSIDVGPMGLVKLWRTDGTLIAISGNSTVKVGETDPQVIKRFEALGQMADGAKELVYAVSTGYSRRIQAAETISGAPMAAVVVLEGADYLKAWRESRDRIGLGILLIVMAMAGTGFFIFAQLSRSELNELALRQAKAAAEEANEAKSRFLAHMSHEFRTPLNAIMGFSEIIKNKVLGEGVSTVYVSYADHIHKSGEHLLNIVNDILDMAKIESGIQPLHAEKLNVLNVTEAAVAFVDRLASERGLRIAVNVPVNLPFVIADERYLRQVLINLLTNAVKFSAPGLEIMIEARRHAKGLDISVRDHGPGIEDSIMRRIGEPFLQSNPSVTRVGQGAGLGLSICKQYMDMLGGELLIDSQCNRGTTAAVRFPPALLADPPVRIISAAE